MTTQQSSIGATLLQSVDPDVRRRAMQWKHYLQQLDGPQTPTPEMRDLLRRIV